MDAIKNQISRTMPGIPLMKSLCGLFITAFALVLIGSGTSHGYTTVVASTAAPAGIENQFIAATTSQFSATVIANPFFGGTYAITLYGMNPSYNPVVTNTQLLQQINLDAQYVADVDSYTYTDGWADGESYQQSQDVSNIAYMTGLCASATNFTLVNTTSSTFNKATCQDALATIQLQIYQLLLSTPAVVPGDWQ